MANPTLSEVNQDTAPGEQDEQGPVLGRMTRDELNVHAIKNGVPNPEAYPNKDALIGAIVAIETGGAFEGEPDPDGDPDEVRAPAVEDDEPDDAEAISNDDEPNAPAPTRYRVIKAITLADGRTVMPGEEFVPDADFPARRPKQLVEQKFLRPID